MEYKWYRTLNRPWNTTTTTTTTTTNNNNNNSKRTLTTTLKEPWLKQLFVTWRQENEQNMQKKNNNIIQIF